MKRFVFMRVLKKTHAFPFLIAFLIFYVIGSIGLWIFDENLSSLADGFWLGFNIITSIGLGDFTVTSFLARVIAVLMGLYGALIVAFIPSLVVSYYLEKMKTNRQITFDHFENEIAHLHEMTPQQRKELSEKVRKLTRLSGKKVQTKSAILTSWRLFALIFRQTHLAHFAVGFIFVYVLCCLGIWIFDPSIVTVSNAFWFGFMIITTIGFGDFTVVHWTSRLITTFLGIYGIFMIAFICGVIASYFFEMGHIGSDQSIASLLYQFENLDQLTEGEIKTLQQQLAKARV